MFSEKLQNQIHKKMVLKVLIYLTFKTNNRLAKEIVLCNIWSFSKLSGININTKKLYLYICFYRKSSVAGRRGSYHPWCIILHRLQFCYYSPDPLWNCSSVSSFNNGLSIFHIYKCVKFSQVFLSLWIKYFLLPVTYNCNIFEARKQDPAPMYTSKS